VDMLMDDLAIWRRVVTDQEALGIFNAGLNGIAVDKASTTNSGKAPIVQVQPVDSIVGANANASLYAGVLGSAALSFQWYFGSNASNVTTLLADATNATLTVTNVTTTNSGFYAMIATNSFGATTSRVAQVGFVSLASITAQPRGQIVSPGATA